MLIASMAVHAQLYLNEFQSKNTVTLADEDGAYSDWVELYNSGPAVNLAGYYLSINQSNLTMWMFPDRTLGANQWQLVWCSKKNRANTTGPLHTNFKLKAGGIPIILTDPNGTIVDQFAPIALITDQSYGRLPDGSPNLVILPAPSPGANNSVLPPPPATVFSKPAGFYKSNFTLTITAWPNTTIYYTLDGSKPTNTSLVYTSPIPIVNVTGNPNVVSMVNTTSPYWAPPNGQVMKATIVRAIVVSGNLSSPITSATYFLDGNFTMPVLSIMTDSANLFDYYTGIYEMGVYWDNVTNWTDPDLTFHPANYENDGDAWERPVHLEVFETNGSLVVNQGIGLRVTGQGSRSRQQKSMKFYARADYGPATIPYPLFPDLSFTSYKRVSIRNGDDDARATYLRDVLAHVLVQNTPLEMEPYRPTVVFLNGEYWGFYPLRDRQSQFYVAARYNMSDKDVIVLTNNAVVDNGNPGDEQSYVDLVEFVRTHDMRDPTNYAYVQTQMDTHDFARYYVANMYDANTDWIDNNVYFWRLRMNGTNVSAPPGKDGRWRWIMHDNDWSFGYNAGQGANYNMFSFIDSKTWGATLWNGLSKNEQFRDYFVTLSADQLMTNFAPDTVISTLDSLAAGVAPEIQREINRWNNIPNVAAWQQNLEQIRQFARDRPTYHRSQIAQYFGLGGTASLTIVTEGQGNVEANSITPTSYPWTGMEFQDVPVTLTATPGPGQVFVGWEGAASGTDATITMVLSQDTTVGAVFASNAGNATTGAPLWVTRKSPATMVNITQYTTPVFLVEVANPGATPYQAQWTLDGAAMQTGGLNYSLGTTSVGAHRLVLTITAGTATLTQTWNITITPNLQLQCYTRVQDLPLTCTGGSITGDTGGGCRQVSCSGASGGVTAIACNKPGDQNPTYYEMYRTAVSGTPPKVCLGTTCISDNGYVHSDLPVCIVVNNGNVTNTTINYSLTVTSAPAGQLSINGTSYGTTPQTVSLRPGQYVVSVSASGYVTNTTTIILSANTTLSLALSPVSNASGNCSSSVNDLLATCSGGSITQDVKGSCRSIVCAAGGNSLSVLACNKPGDYNPQYFEMYKQGQTGSGVTICIATTCISNSGYTKSPNFPICTGNVTPPSDTTPPVISNGQPSGTLLAGTTSATLRVSTDEPATCRFDLGDPQLWTDMIDFATTGGTTHSQPLVGLTDGESKTYYVRCRDAAGNIDPTSYVVSFSIATPPPNGTNVTATLSIAPWFPQGRNYVFRCAASGFTPTSYDWLFGDGHKQLGMLADNVYHTYANAGNYTVGCTAHTATQSASATLPITVS